MRRIFLSLLLLCLGATLIAQDFRGGITAGMVGSQVAGDCCSGYNKAGFYVGGYVYYPLGERSTAQMELQYIQKGSRQNPKEENDYNSYLLRIHYVELPVLYKYSLLDQLSLEIGLSYAVYVASKEKADEQEAVSGKAFNRHNLNFIAGLYYNITDNFRINLRSDNSITPIRPHVSGKTRFFNQGQYSDLICLGLQIDL